MMVKVKFFGLLRIDSGIKEMELEADSLKALYPLIISKAEEMGCKALNMEMLRACAVNVNGKAAVKGQKLSPGDTVCLFPPVAGG